MNLLNGLISISLSLSIAFLSKNSHIINTTFAFNIMLWMFLIKSYGIVLFVVRLVYFIVLLFVFKSNYFVDMIMTEKADFTCQW